MRHCWSALLSSCCALAAARADMLLPGCCWCTSTCCPMSGWIDHIGAARALPITDLDMQFAVGCQSQSYASQSNVGRTATVEPQPSNQVTSVQMQACHNPYHRESKSIECVQGQDFPPHRIDPAFGCSCNRCSDRWPPHVQLPLDSDLHVKASDQGKCSRCRSHAGAYCSCRCSAAVAAPTAAAAVRTPHVLNSPFPHTGLPVCTQQLVYCATNSPAGTWICTMLSTRHALKEWDSVRELLADIQARAAVHPSQSLPTNLNARSQRVRHSMAAFSRALASPHGSSCLKMR